MIKAVIFDADGVIYYRDRETLKPITDFFSRKKLRISAEKFQEAFDRNLIEAYQGKISKDLHLKKTLGNLKINFDEKFFMEFAYVFRKFHPNTKKTKGIVSLFRKIKNIGMKIAILTDTFTTEEKKWESFSKIGIAKYIDAVICSSATGYTKNEKEAYSTATRKLRIRNSEAVFVGHRKYEMDGARKAGVTAISLEKDIGGDFYASSISKIPGILKKLQ